MGCGYGPIALTLAALEPAAGMWGVDVDPTAAEATYERGLVTVVLPLAPKPRTGRVTIVVAKAT